MNFRKDDANFVIKNKYSNHYLFFLIFLILLFCSQSSPLYVMNSWVDANCYMTIGRSMLNGMMPYSDLFDHKGPILYIMHMFAAFISPNSFYGVFFLEVIAGFFFLYYSKKVIELFCRGNSLIWTSFLSMIVYTSLAFVNGDSAEEFCLPALMYVFYIGVKAVNKNNIPSRNESFAIGIAFAYILWIKFSLLGLFVGISIFYIDRSIVNKKFKSFCLNLLICLFGILLLSILIMSFFSYKQCLYDMLNVYFYDNIYGYSNVAKTDIYTSLFNFSINILAGMYSFFEVNRLWFLFILPGLIFPLKKEIGVFARICFCLSFALVYGGGRFYQYYSFPFAIFLCLSFCVLDCYVGERIKSISLVFVFLLCSLFAFYFTPNKPMRNSIQEKYCLEPYAKIVNSRKNPKLVLYDIMDVGLYNYCNIVPECKYFYRSNLIKDDYDSVIMSYINNNKVDYILSTDDKVFLGYKVVYVGDKLDFYSYKKKLCLFEKMK